MTEKFIELQTLLDGVEVRKQAAFTRVNELCGRIAQIEQDRETNTIMGIPTAETARELRGLRNELEDAERDALIFRTSVKDQQKIMQRDPRISKLADEILQDNAKRIAALKDIFERKVEALKQIKTDYLKMVAELGALNNEAGGLCGEQNKARKYVAGEENVNYSHGLCYDPRGDGPAEIYQDQNTIKDNFKKGRIDEKH